ncbi:MAG TPA: hypothetical protein VFC73_02415 [Syntrophomonadaceae bacterium]|nr:hypothetical protein [Syntrophomonadaceae bacterium]
MLEKMLIFIILILAIGFIYLRFRNAAKGDVCSGCTSECSACHIELEARNEAKE